LNKRRDLQFEAALGRALSFYAFVFEDFGQKASKNKELFPKLGIMLVELQDAFRGILLGQASLSPVVLASLARISLEVRANLEFVFTRQEPGFWADRYKRYAEADRLAHDLAKEPGKRLLDEAEIERIKELCPEWVHTTRKGELKVLHYWTADESYRSVKSIAGAVGLAHDYQSIYSVTSTFVHGSYLLVTAYRDGDSIRPVGGLKLCKQLAFLAAHHCLSALREASSFFGVALDELALGEVQAGLRSSCRELL